MQEIQPTQLQQRLANKIALRIVEEDLRIDTPLRESALAKELGVSRSPIRGALSFLESQGILNSEPNKGFRVARAASDIDISRLDYTPVEDGIYSRILSDRVKGELRDTETEADMIRRYDVPRSKLLRALERLAQDGILERSTGYGWNFQPSLNTVEAHDESYAFRILIEPAGPLQPTFKLDRRKLEASREDHARLLEKNRTGVMAQELFDVNAAFHEMIADFSGNRFMAQAVRQQNNLRRLLEYKGFQTPKLERVKHSCEEHLAILDALDAGDNDWASKLLYRHLHVASGLKLGFQSE